MKTDIPATFSPANRDNTTVVVIAGGLGERMGQRNKGLIRFAGKPLLEPILVKMAA